jgi:riboflavin transporter FmnP
MIKSIAISKPQFFPVVLKYTDIRSYVFTAIFVALAVLLPWVFHQYHLAGPTFLPMHIFVLIAGLVFGWRAGLIVGLLSLLASYTISGMPALQILPQTTAELSTYGLVAGILRERFNLRVIWSLLGAMVAGRLALCLAVLGIYYSVGEIYSPLGLEAKPLSVLLSVVKQGWPGIVIQLALIPATIWLGEKLTTKKSMW